ncbi:hypothetical protein [Cereibacter sphaeroides]|uniref:hypothetical protein n=1 Tax=Cereibacter sphaeroides TaxID=1063 RepID=UPI001F200076|nr:hypothetical protein [Cereibacter sphaeroides]
MFVGVPMESIVSYRGFPVSAPPILSPFVARFAAVAYCWFRIVKVAVGAVPLMAAKVFPLGLLLLFLSVTVTGPAVAVVVVVSLLPASISVAVCARAGVMATNRQQKSIARSSIGAGRRHGRTPWSIGISIECFMSPRRTLPAAPDKESGC